MTSSYVNNLRLNEMGTGDESGNWGVVTNTNLTLIADALGFQSFTVANSNADDLIIPNGTETNNEAISLYVKLEGGNQAATITLGPNTVKKLWIIENSTSHVMTLTQGNGANVILASGVTKMVYANGTGTGASVVDALLGLEVGANFYIKNAATGDNSTAQLYLQTAEADIAANDVLGKINFQAPNEGTGTDAILVAAAIQAKSEGDFSSSSNATSLEFMTGASEAAATKMTLSSAGDLTLTSTTASSSSTTGAVKIGGGLGVAADLFVGDDLDVAGAVVIDETALVTGVLTTTAGITSGSNIVSDTDSTDDLGATGARWANLYVDAITATDQITATGFTGTLDGILGSGTAAAASVTNLTATGIVDAVNFKIDGAQGTDGQVLTSTGSGVAFEAAGGGAMTLIATHTVGDTTTNRFTMNNVLSTTYTNYLILARNMYTSTDDDMFVQIEDASGVITDNGTYDQGRQTATNTYEAGAGGTKLLNIYLKRASAQIVPSDFVLNLTTNDISGSHKVTVQGKYYWSQYNYWFDVSGNIRATNSQTNSAYSGTPSGLSFKVQSGSNYFVNTATVRIYGFNKS